MDKDVGHIFIDTKPYYSAIEKKNEIMPSAATWMDLEMVIPSKGSQTEAETSHSTPYMQTLKRNGTRVRIKDF